MTMKISIKGFKLLRPIAKKTKCRVRIFRKKGVPFILNRYKARKTFFVGALIFVLVFFTFTSFIWSIEINGNKKIESQMILEHLSKYGVKPGEVKYGINTDQIVNYLMMDIKDFAWVGVTVKGTKIKIDVAERVNPPDLIEKEIPCDIVAKKDGVIKAVIAKAGYEKVKEGDTVVKGQILISGNVPNKDEKIAPRQVHALGTVNARTWYEKECIVNTRVIDKERTGKIKNFYSAGIFMKKINIFHSNVPFENYDKIEIVKKISIGQDIVLPFELDIERYYENKLSERQIDLDEAKKNAEDLAYKQALEEVPENAEIVKTDLEVKQKDSGELVADAVIECVEDIGNTCEIGGN
jgi:similar to stage IV sporulation protein